jgi:hypothetical protein
MRHFFGNTFLIAGGVAHVPAVLALLAEEGIETNANPDLYVRSYRQFGIDDAHELRTRAAARAIGDRRVFVISTGGITTEAQNALLKTLEEPPADALFIFLVPAPAALLATVRSRSQIMQLGEDIATNNSSSVDIAAFVAASLAKRIDMLKSVLEKDDDDKYDTAAILTFLSELEQYAAGIKDPVALQHASSVIYRARMYSTDRGALLKTLLESVALLMPVL